MGLIFLTLLNMQQQQTREKAHELRGQEDSALITKLNTLREELVKLRTSKVSSGPQVKLARIRVVRKSIAKVLTVVNEKRRSTTHMISEPRDQGMPEDNLPDTRETLKPPEPPREPATSSKESSLSLHD